MYQPGSASKISNDLTVPLFPSESEVATVFGLAFLETFLEYENL